jgi:hypothetical protein
MRPVHVRFALLALALTLSACASLALRNPPRIDVVGVSLDRVEGADAYFRIDVMLTNRVADDVVIDALQGTLSIEGVNVAQAALANAPVRIPADGSTHAEMTAHTGMDAVLRAVAEAMRHGAMIVAPGARPVLHYTIEGSATLAGGARLPFARSGVLGERRP